MRRPSLKQATKLLQLASAKKLSADRLDRLDRAGLLSDLLEVEEVESVDREAFRKFLKLPPRILPTLAIGVSCCELTPPFDGWELAENATSPVGTLSLQLAEFLENGEESVKGKVMRERAKKHGLVLGEIHAHALREVHDKIPEEWHPFYLAFPGTLWRAPGGDLHIPYLFLNRERWYLYWRWLGRGWDSNSRIVVPSA